MKIEQFILNILLSIEKLILSGLKKEDKRVLFITNESEQPEGDFEAVIEELKSRGYTNIHFCGMKFTGKLSSKFRYLFKCLVQYYEMRKASVLILNDNNYIANGKFKPEGLKVIQIWHASGAIKKFGAQLDKRKYEITGYDKVICSGVYWQGIFSEAFNTPEENVIPAGLPRTEDLKRKAERYADHKKAILYAPTFRGNSLDGLDSISLNADYVKEHLPEDWIWRESYHPLNIDKPHRDTYSLMAQSDILVTDYSAITFDFATLHRPVVFYIPDYETYKEYPGLNVDLPFEFPGYVAYTEDELIAVLNRIIENEDDNSIMIDRKYMVYDYKLIDEIEECINA